MFPSKDLNYLTGKCSAIEKLTSKSAVTLFHFVAFRIPPVGHKEVQFSNNSSGTVENCLRKLTLSCRSTQLKVLTPHVEAAL